MNTIENHMNTIESEDPKQVTAIKGTSNPLGEAVAAMILGYRSVELKGINIVAERITNDFVLGDYIAISFDSPDEEGGVARSNRSVAIMPVPPSETMLKHVVRFTNFNRVEEQREVYLMNVRNLLNAIIEFLLTGEVHEEER